MQLKKLSLLLQNDFSELRNESPDQEAVLGTKAAAQPSTLGTDALYGNGGQPPARKGVIGPKDYEATPRSGRVTRQATKHADKVRVPLHLPSQVLRGQSPLECALGRCQVLELQQILPL